jgi:quinol monooxygenase YgiN
LEVNNFQLYFLIQPSKMPVTELAILPLTHNLTQETPNLPASVKQKLISAKLVLQKASGHKFYFFQQVEDPSIIYIIGSWESPQAHATFLPSTENQKLLELFKDDIIAEETDGKKMTMWHLDADVFSGVNEEDKPLFTAPVISLNRHFVPGDKKAGFVKKFDEVKGLLEDFTTPYQVVGGWRIEKEEEGKDEWVLFSGFGSVENHHEFAKTEAFVRYREIVEFVGGFELRHMRVVEGL